MKKKKHTLLFGAHMSIAGSFEKAIQRGESINCTAIQIFTKSNRQWRAKPIAPTETEPFKEAVKSSSIQSVIAHASYLINIGSPQEHIEGKSCNALSEELRRCQQLGIQYLVLHPGAHLNSGVNECLERISHNLDTALEQVGGDVTILLENTAGQGTNIGYTFEQLAAIRKKANNKKRIQFCFDTCHAFAAGYDFSTPKTYAGLWETFDKVIGLEHLKAMHINDSQKERDSHVDRHQHIGEGKLGLEAFRLLFNDPRFFDIPKILETPKEDDLVDDEKNMAKIKSLLSETTKKVLNFSDEEQSNSSN